MDEEVYLASIKKLLFLPMLQRITTMDECDGSYVDRWAFAYLPFMRQQHGVFILFAIKKSSDEHFGKQKRLIVIMVRVNLLGAETLSVYIRRKI